LCTCVIGFKIITLEGINKYHTYTHIEMCRILSDNYKEIEKVKI